MKTEISLHLFLRLYPSPVLRERGQMVTEFDDRFRDTCAQMHKLLELGRTDEKYRPYFGYALAAPQVGVAKAFFVTSPEYWMQWPKVVANPVYLSDGEEIRFKESCLSLPGIAAWTKRYKEFMLHYQDEFGDKHTIKADGLFSIVAQHEMDHLTGTLFIDRLDSFELGKVQGAINKMRRK